MAVNAIRARPVKSAEFIKLGQDHVFERTRESRMKYDLCQAMTPQIAREASLMLGESRGRARSRKWRCEIQVQTGVNALFPSDFRRALRIFHEYHGADGRDRTRRDSAILKIRLVVSWFRPPIIGVYG